MNILINRKLIYFKVNNYEEMTNLWYVSSDLYISVTRKIS